MATLHWIIVIANIQASIIYSGNRSEMAETKRNHMKQNMGAIDKAVRILVAIVIGILYFTHLISGTVAIVLLILAGIFIVTSFMSFCPLYLPFGISTKKKTK
jgi:uncharacterized membrane protein